MRIDRKHFRFSLYHDLKDRLNCPAPAHIADNQVAFLMAAKTSEWEEVRKLLGECVRSHLQIPD